MGRAHCRFEVFAATEPSEEIEEATEDSVSLAIHSRDDNPDAFCAPRFETPVNRGETFRVAGPAGQELVSAIDDARTCYVVEVSIEEPADLGFLEESMALALSIAEATEGVIVDRTSDIGYTAQQFEPQSEDPEIRDTVSLEETAAGETVSLRSRGMSKYAEADFAVESFPAEHVELARRLLLDNLCLYSAFQSSIQSGQNLQYKRDNPLALLYFAEVEDGLLRVTDMDESKKTGSDNLNRFLDISLPAFVEQRKSEVFDEAASRARLLIEEGRDEEALRDLERCLDIKPANVWALGEAVDVLARLVGAGASGLGKRRDELAEALLAKHDDSFGAKVARARALVALASDPSRALDLSRRAANQVPDDVLAQLCLAKALLAGGDRDGALGILAWLESIHAGVVAAHVADAADDVTTAKPMVPDGSGIPVTESPPEVDEPASSPDEPLDEMDQWRLRVVRYGDDGWQRSRNAAAVALLLEAPIAVEEVARLRFSDVDLDSGHARFADGYLQLEQDTIDKLRHWALTFPAHPKLHGRVGPRYVLSGNDLEPIVVEEIEDLLRAVGDQAGVHKMSLERIETTFAVQQAFDDSDEDEEDEGY